MLSPFQMFPPSLWSDFHWFFLTGAHRHINFAAQTRFSVIIFPSRENSSHPRVTHNYSPLFHVGGWLSRGDWVVEIAFGPVAKIALSRLGGRKINPCPKTCGSRRKNLRKTTNSHTHFSSDEGENFTVMGGCGLLGGKIAIRIHGGFHEFHGADTGKNIHLGRLRHWEWRFWRDSAMFYLRFWLGKFRRLSGKATTEDRWR